MSLLQVYPNRYSSLTGESGNSCAVNAVHEHLAQDVGGAIRHHRRATVDELVEQFDHFARGDGFGVAVTSLGQYVGIDHALHLQLGERLHACTPSAC